MSQQTAPTAPDRVIVVGAANSVGREIAARFSSSGARVHACDIDENGLAELTRFNSKVTTHRMNALDPLDVEAVLRRALNDLGGIDVLVNTVGLPGPRAPLEEVSYSDWEDAIRGSAGAAFFSIKQVIPYMKQQRSGCIITFSSCSTKTGLPHRTPYVVAKFAVEGLTKNLARELGPFNIRVNAVLPGPIDNRRLASVVAAAAAANGITAVEYEASLLRYISMRQKVSIEEVACAVLFLASPAAPHITGQLLSVDGNAEWEE
jgi:NAD(P)-dependent dehydrogenase (short-subunit alcohol dehydrogenase family)